MIPTKSPSDHIVRASVLDMGVSENRRKGICSFAAVLTFVQIKPAKINLSLFGRF